MVSQVNIYTKFLISSNCEFDESEGNDTSNFCPGYSDALATPYPGSKEAKLQDMSDMFCTHCAPEDKTCSQLFCAPSRQLVTVTMAMISSFCANIQQTFPSCYSEFCTTSVSKRKVHPPRYSLSSTFECTASSDWSVVTGMDQWCQSNCKEGNNPVTCPESYCHCLELEGTTVSANSLVDRCLKWAASLAWSKVPGMNSWCKSTCSLGGDCPESHCQCVETLPASRTTSTTTTTTNPTTTNSTTNPPTTASTITISSNIPATNSAKTPTTSITKTSTTTTTMSITKPFTTSTSDSKTTSSTTSAVSSTISGTSTVAITANLTDADSQYVVSAIICDEARSRNQNLLSDRYCNNQARIGYTGYSSVIMDEVLSFAPKILCAFSNSAGRSDACPNMFCGESPLAQHLIKSSLCSVCQQFSDSLAPSCASAYCS